MRPTPTFVIFSGFFSLQQEPLLGEAGRNHATPPKQTQEVQNRRGACFGWPIPACCTQCTAIGNVERWACWQQSDLKWWPCWQQSEPEAVTMLAAVWIWSGDSSGNSPNLKRYYLAVTILAPVWTWSGNHAGTSLNLKRWPCWQYSLNLKSGDHAGNSMNLKFWPCWQQSEPEVVTMLATVWTWIGDHEKVAFYLTHADALVKRVNVKD